MKILIGSYPLVNYHNIKMPRRVDDIDIVINSVDLQSLDLPLRKTKIEGKYLSSLSNKTLDIDATNSPSNIQLFNMTKDMKTTVINDIEFFVPNISTLIAIKESHVRFPVNHFKNIRDWQELHKLKSKYPYTKEDKKLLEIRRNEAYERNESLIKRINLNKPNKEFFKPAQNLRKFDHDELHRVVAFNDKPVFEMVKKDLSKAAVDREMFESLPKKMQLQMAIEESMVIGYERFSDKSKNYHSVYGMGFAFFSTTLCKGWFQDFIFDNFDKLCQLQDEFDIDFVSLIKSKENEIERVA